MDYEYIAEQAKNTLIQAASTVTADKIEMYKKAIENETNDKAKWVLESILENILIAAENKSPLCDDTGIPHVVLEVGKKLSFRVVLLKP